MVEMKKLKQKAENRGASHHLKGKLRMQFSIQFSGFPKSGVYDTFWDEKKGEVNQP